VITWARVVAWRLALAWLALSLAACVTVQPPRPTPEAAAGADPRAAWARLLSAHVLEDGRIDFAALRRDPRDLETYVAWLATHGPKSTPALFPTPESRLAYHVNAYNAVAMHHVVASPRRPQEQIRFFLLSSVVIDAERLSLYAYENRIIRPLGDPRVHFALNCMVRGCPRLPREPFDALQLDAQLEREARRFLNEPRNVQVDPPLGVVRLSSILRFYKGDFVARAPSLIAYVNRYREEPIPDGYRVGFIPYDWALQQR